MLANAFRQQARLALSRSLFSLPSRSIPVVRSATALRLPTNTSSFSTSLARWSDVAGSASSGKLFVGNLPYTTDESELKDIFAEFGDVVEVNLAKGPDGRPRGFAHVTFANSEQARNSMDAHSASPLYSGDRQLRLDYSVTNERSSAPASPSERLHFSGFHGGPEELREALGEFADQCRDIFFLRNRTTGANRDTGFLEFPDVATATTVLEKLNGKQILGTTLELAFARPRAERAPSFDGPGSRRPQFGDRESSYSGARNSGFGQRAGGYGGDRRGRDGGYGNRDGGRDSGYGNRDGGRDGGYGGRREGGYGGGRAGGYGGGRDGGYGGGRDGGHGGRRDGGESGFGFKRREGGRGGFGIRGGDQS